MSQSELLLGLRDAIEDRYPAIYGQIGDRSIRFRARNQPLRLITVELMGHGISAATGTDRPGRPVWSIHCWTVPYTDETIIAMLGVLVEAHLLGRPW